MKFAVYYDITDKMNKLINEGKLDSYKDSGIEEVYLCEDVHDFWIARLYKDLNSEFENEEGTWLLERNIISKYDLIDFINEPEEEKYLVRDRRDRDYIIESLDDKTIVENILFLDDSNNLEGWDNYQYDSRKKALNELDGGFGIKTYKERKSSTQIEKK